VLYREASNQAVTLGDSAQVTTLRHTGSHPCFVSAFVHAYARSVHEDGSSAVLAAFGNKQQYVYIFHLLDEFDEETSP
jgi:hypothetical protein